MNDQDAWIFLSVSLLLVMIRFPNGRSKRAGNGVSEAELRIPVCSGQGLSWLLLAGNSLVA